MVMETNILKRKNEKKNVKDKIENKKKINTNRKQEGGHVSDS